MSVMWVTMFFSFRIFLQFFTYYVVVQTTMLTSSKVDSTLTMTDVDTPQSVAQGRYTRICAQGAEICASLGYLMTTSGDATTSQHNLAQIIQANYNVVSGVTDANAHSPVTETQSSFAGNDDTAVTNKTASVITQIATDRTKNDIDTTRADSSTDVYQNSTDAIRFPRNDSWNSDPQSNKTYNETFGTLANATDLSVEEDYWQEGLQLKLYTYLAPFVIIIGTLGNSVSIITHQHRDFRHTATAFIFTALSCVDIATLNNTLMSYFLMSAFEVYVRTFSRFSCKIAQFIAYTLHTLSSWTLVLLTAERSISVLFPLRCKEICSKRHIIIAWVIIALCVMTENSFFVLAFDLRPNILDLGDNNTSTVSYSCAPTNI